MNINFKNNFFLNKAEIELVEKDCLNKHITSTCFFKDKHLFKTNLDILNAHKLRPVLPSTLLPTDLLEDMPTPSVEPPQVTPPGSTLILSWTGLWSQLMALHHPRMI